MSIFPMVRSALLVCLPVLVCAQQPSARSDAASAQAATAPQTAGSPGSQSLAQNSAQSPTQDPKLTQRAPAQPASAAIHTNRIQLNVVVTDAKGIPVSGLTQRDFTLFDNKRPRPIVSFHAYDGTAQKPNPPVHVILLLDSVNIDFRQVAYERQQMGKFLEENGGHLAQPVSLYLLSNSGVSGQRETSVNGNDEAANLNQIDGQLRTITRSTGVYGAIERFQLSLRAISSVVESEAGIPGRKLLIWMGPGWPLLSGIGFQDPTEKEQQQLFSAIVALSTRLRESQITLYSVQAGQLNGFSYYYQSFLKGVPSPRQTANGDLDVRVLATQSGGLALGPDNGLADQIDRCVHDASAFYTITFDRPQAGKQDEYHDLKVQVDRPRLAARTSTGYYNQPPGPPMP